MDIRLQLSMFLSMDIHLDILGYYGYPHIDLLWILDLGIIGKFVLFRYFLQNMPPKNITFTSKQTGTIAKIKKRGMSYCTR